jgi:PIN domain nuclease of toxin-antitoxin system
MIVLDTHALLWWALDPDRLSEAAAIAIREMENQGGFASAISIWELGIKIQRGKVELGISIEELVRRLRKSGIIQLLAVDAETWLRSLDLP